MCPRPVACRASPAYWVLPARRAALLCMQFFYNFKFNQSIEKFSVFVDTLNFPPMYVVLSDILSIHRTSEDNKVYKSFKNAINLAQLYTGRIKPSMVMLVGTKTSRALVMNVLSNYARTRSAYAGRRAARGGAARCGAARRRRTTRSALNQRLYTRTSTY